MAGVSSRSTGRTNGTPGWPGPPVRNSSVPSRARELSPAATWSRSVPGTFPDLSSGTARYEQVKPGWPGHGCAPVSAGRAGGVPGRAPGAAVQATATRASVMTVAAARVARAAGRDMRMLVPPGQRSGLPVPLPLGWTIYSNDRCARWVHATAGVTALQPVGALCARLPWEDGIGSRGAAGPDAPYPRCSAERGMGVLKVSAEEYPAPPAVVGRGAVFVEHRLKIPQASESAYIAPTAVLAGDVTVGPHSRVLFGAVITAEGGPVEIGRNCVIMEHAVIRGVPGQVTRIGDEVLVGPHAHLTGCVIEGGSRIATGAMVFNGARIERGAEVEFNAVVYVNTVVAAGTAVPMGWFAGGQPAELVAPGEWDRIRAIMGPLDYPGTVFGAGDSDTRSLMSGVARRYARGLALHHRDHVVPDERHLPAEEDPR